MSNNQVGPIVVGPSDRDVVLFRHLQQFKAPGTKPNDWVPNNPLKWEAAIPVAERVQAAYLPGVPVVHYAGVSELVRTFQTLALIAPQAKRISLVTGLTPPDYNNVDGTWDCLANMAGETAAEMATTAPELFEQCGKIAFNAVLHTAKYEIGNGQLAVLVSHNPMCEAALARLLLGGVDALPFPNFAKGDGVRFTFRNGEIVNWQHLPVPPAPPSS